MAKKEQAPQSRGQRAKGSALVGLGFGIAVLGASNGGLDFGSEGGGGGSSVERNNSAYCSNPSVAAELAVTKAQVSTQNVGAISNAKQIADIQKIDFLYDNDVVEYNEAWDFARAVNEFYDHSATPRSEELSNAAGRIVVYTCTK